MAINQAKELDEDGLCRLWSWISNWILCLISFEKTQANMDPAMKAIFLPNGLNLPGKYGSYSQDKQIHVLNCMPKMYALFRQFKIL